MAGGVEFRRASEWASYLTTWTDWTTCKQQQGNNRRAMILARYPESSVFHPVRFLLHGLPGGFQMQWPKEEGLRGSTEDCRRLHRTRVIRVSGGSYYGVISS
jgi:hypothetical protein